MSVYDELVGRIERAEARINDLEGDVRFLRGLLANPHLSSSQKLILWAVRDLIERTGRPQEQLTEIDVRELGKTIGTSRFTAGKQLQELARMGAIVREERTEATEGRYGRKVYRTHIHVGLTLFTARPAELQPTQPRNHGGKRERCEKCGGENLEVYEAYICKDCGHIHQAELKKETKGRRGFVAES